MRFREKMILIIMGLLILAVFLEALPTIYPEFDGRINNEIEPNANDQTKVVGQPQFPISLRPMAGVRIFFMIGAISTIVGSS